MSQKFRLKHPHNMCTANDGNIWKYLSTTYFLILLSLLSWSSTVVSEITTGRFK